MRDRLIELLCNVKCEGEESFGNCPQRIGQKCNKVQRLEMCAVFAIADHLLAEGVIVPPCKVGDTIYKPIITSRGKPAIWEIIVTNISIFIEKNGVSPASYVIGHLKRTRCGESADFCEFGKTVFLTREEAEKALERREG